MTPKEAIVIDLNDKTEYQRLLAGAPQTCGMKAGRVHLKPGEDVGQHSTDAREEILVFLSGQGQALINENKTLNVAVGNVAYVPPHTTHNIKNTGTTPLIYIFCVTPIQN